MDEQERRRKAFWELDEVLAEPEVGPTIGFGHPPSATKTFVNFVVRPYTMIVAVLGMVLLVRKDWLQGGILLVSWVIISVSGQTALNRFGLRSGISDLSHEESFSISKLAVQIGMSVAAAFFVILLRRGLHWYFGLPVACLAGFLGVLFQLIALVRIFGRAPGR
jgi:hypothetical protein